MTDVYSIWKGPQYEPLTANDMMSDALNQPMGFLDTLTDQFKGGVLNSPLAGTAIRETMLPDRIERPPGRHLPMEDKALRAKQEADYENRLFAKKDYENSPYFRKDVPWDNGMTEERAAALAAQYDVGKVREYFASKRPYTAFVGGLAGFAVDPLNYIPVAGPLVKGAAVLRLGRIGGAMAAASADAISNVALGQALSYQERRSMGDHITWQSTVSELAMAGLVGAAFGGLHGTVDFYRERGAETRLAEQRRIATEQLSTLENTQSARIALNDAIGSVVRGEDVNINPTSVDAIKAMSDRMNPVTKRDLFSSTTAARGTDTRAPIISDFESLVRNKVLGDDPVLSQSYKDAEAKVMEASANLDLIKSAVDDRKLSDTLALIDPESAKIVAAIEKELATTIPAPRRQALEAQREQITESIGPELIAKTESDFRIGPQKKIKAAQAAAAKARNEFSKVDARVSQAAKKTVAENRPLLSSRLDTSTAPVEARPRELTEAAARVGKPESMEELAAQYGVKVEKAKAKTKAELPKQNRPPILSEDDPAFVAMPPHMQTIERDWRFANSLGVVDDIEKLSAQQMTARQIVNALGTKLKRVDELSALNGEEIFAVRNKEQMVRAVRGKLEIPSLDETTAFNEWLSGYNLRQNPGANKIGNTPEDGSFVEQADIDQVRNEGRLTEEDEAELKRADQTFENGEAYGEALKAAISCLI